MLVFMNLCSIYRDLSYNHLTGEIPFNIGFLQVATLYVLVTFPFQHCYSLLNISYISLSKSKLLNNRSLQGNKLSGNIPEVIGLMQALTVL